MPLAMRTAGQAVIGRGACPYLPNRSWETTVVVAESLEGRIYEHLLDNGWRRGGYDFYRNVCPGCEACVAMRVPTLRFAPTASQRRAAKKNRDLRITLRPVADDDDVFRLYCRYLRFKHRAESQPARRAFAETLGSSPLDTWVMRYFDGPDLVGAGWLDVVPQGLSTVYFAFAPEAANRSLGVYSVLREIELCRELNKPWYYLGFWVADSPKMAYKTNYRPFQLLINGVWQEAGRQEPGHRAAPATPATAAPATAAPATAAASADSTACAGSPD